jgi:uncharacterized LabA/DUF88 family protein
MIRFSPIRPLIDWLDYNSYTVITQTIKEFVDPAGRRKLKGDMNVELEIQAMELAQYIDHLSYSRAMRQRRDRDKVGHRL